MSEDDVSLRLRQGKERLRDVRRRASLEEKFLELVQAQRLYVAIAGTRRPLSEIEQPWDLESGRRSNS